MCRVITPTLGANRMRSVASLRGFVMYLTPLGKPVSRMKRSVMSAMSPGSSHNSGKAKVEEVEVGDGHSENQTEQISTGRSPTPSSASCFLTSGDPQHRNRDHLGGLIPTYAADAAGRKEHGELFQSASELRLFDQQSSAIKLS